MTFEQKVTALRHLMAAGDDGGDFAPPTLLKEVPSITLTHTQFEGALENYAELGGRAGGDRRRAAAGSSII